MQRLCVERNPDQRLIYGLKAITAVPPVPPDYAVATDWRHRMLADLRQFTEYIATKQPASSVSIEVSACFTSKCNGISFNMCSFSGFNDVRINSLQHVPPGPQ